MTPQRRIRVAGGVFAAVVVIGVVGYRLLEDFTLLEALYMTVITVTTVGYGEVGDLSPAARVFTIGVIMAGFGSATYAVATAAEFVVEGHLRRAVRQRRIDRRIRRLHDHVIVCGLGRLGWFLVDDLVEDGVDVVVLDVDEERVERARERGLLTVSGDATEEDVLREAGVDRARALVACLDTDAANVLVVVTAKGVRPDLPVLGRVKATENESKLLRAGADTVVAPQSVGAQTLAQRLTRPVVARFLDAVNTDGSTDYAFEEVRVRAGDELDGVALKDTRVRERFHCTVLAVQRGADGVLDTHPVGDAPLRAGDVLVVIGSREGVAGMRRHLGG